MDRTHWISALTLLAVTLGVATALKVDSISRELAAEGQVVTTTDTIKLTNDQSSPVTTVHWCVSDLLAQHQAYLEAGAGTDTADLQVSLVALDGAPSGSACYAIDLEIPLNSQQTGTVEVYAVYTKLLQPYPAEVAQSDPQRVLLTAPLYALLPYSVASTTFKVKLPNGKVEAYSEVSPVTKRGSDITYGPYTNVPPFAQTTVTIHFENNEPFAEVRQLVREIEVSHWGNIYVEESYQLVHGGAKHKGGWSRLDYQTNPYKFGPSAIKSVKAILPSDARSLYYRDEIGNVSTSRVRFEKDKVEAELVPRYPLFGGWKTNFVFGYSLPLSKYVEKIGDGKLLLQLDFSTPIGQLVIDEMFVRVVLPEGSYDFTVDYPFGAEQSSDTKFTYLDTIGRPVVVLRKTNVVTEHNVPVTVTYKFATISILREPLLLIGAFALFFATIMVYVRCDFVIAKDDKYQAKLAKEKATDIAQAIQGLLGERKRLIGELDNTLASGTIDQCNSAKSQVEASLKTADTKLRDLLKELEGISPKNIAGLRELLDKEKSFYTTYVSVYSKKVQLLKDGVKPLEMEKKLGPQEKALSELKKEVTFTSSNLFDSY